MSNEAEKPTIPAVILEEKYQLHATAARLCVERIQSAAVAGDSAAGQFSAAGAVRHYNACIEMIEDRLRTLEGDGESRGAIPIIGGGPKDA